NARNYDSESPKHEGFESEDSEPEDNTSFNNTRTSKGMSASQKTCNPEECNNEDFDPAPLNNNIEDSKCSHSRSQSQRQSRLPRHSQYFNS
ncbi:43999_t:CDS:2, partial [Gigaspora margarita]